MNRRSAINERSWEALPTRRNRNSVSDHSSGDENSATEIEANIGYEVEGNVGEPVERVVLDLHDMFLELRDCYENNRLLYMTFLNELESYLVRCEADLRVSVPE